MNPLLADAPHHILNLCTGLSFRRTFWQIYLLLRGNVPSIFKDIIQIEVDPPPFHPIYLSYICQSSQQTKYQPPTLLRSGLRFFWTHTHNEQTKQMDNAIN